MNSSDKAAAIVMVALVLFAIASRLTDRWPDHSSDCPPAAVGR